MSYRIRVEAPAKVNLCLAVGDLRDDGYHAVETVLHCIELADTVTVSPADRLSLKCEPSVGVPDDRNLAYKAAIAFRETFDLPVDVAIHVQKRIPPGAGLAGGSSDAAAVLAALASLNGIDRTDPGCLAAAELLGADVAFFLHGACALMTGRGEKLVRALPPLDAPLAIVKPERPVPTGAAYSAFDADPQPAISCDGVVEALEARDPGMLAASLANNLEVAAATVVPDVAVALAWARAQEGVRAALLAGSGSALFTLTDDAAAAEAIAGAARQRGWWSAATTLSGRGMLVSEEGA